MYLCLCRPLTESETKAYALQPRNLGKDFAKISQEITKQPMQCGQCEEAGDEFLDELRTAHPELAVAALEQPA